MRILNFILIIATLQIVTGCTSMESLVVSKKADITIESGVVYSLPKQLIKVTYTRSRLKKTDEEKKKTLAFNAVTNKEKELQANKKKIASFETTRDNIALDAINRDVAIAKLELSITTLKATRLVLSKEMLVNKKKLNKATNDYAKSLASPNAFSEELKMVPEEHVVDQEHTFYAQINHRIQFSDSLEIKTKNGLLDGALGSSSDKSGDVISSIAGGLSGLFQPSLMSLTGNKMMLEQPQVPNVDGCQKDDAISITQIIDPHDEDDLKALNEKLMSGCIKIDLTSPDKPKNSDLASKQTVNGLLYRQPGEYHYQVKDSTNSNLLHSIRLNLAQGGQIGYISMEKGRFSKNEYDVSFSKGVLVQNKVNLPSELLSAAMILPNTLKAIFAIPTELIQLKVNYSSGEKTIAENNKAILDAQVEITKQQKVLDELILETNNIN
ncbi:hypothetical protein [Crocosphaera sp.]|uniref:hypothetical protein n=1 Tax=Crocosphaera sp. TaxID=2729996 RepID=UPI00257A8C2C|nr:hypothetical protein [Crocosphaera sp.]